MTYVFQHEFGLYMVFAALLFGFILSFAVGANDSANSWGTPVGAGTVSLGVAFLLGSIMEMLGSVFLSGEVVATVAGNKSVVNMELYKSDNETECDNFMAHNETLFKEKTLVLGLVTSMVASQIWQLMATYLAWPVSGTHTIISALMGFTLVEHGSEGINIGNPDLFHGSGVFKVIYGLLVSPVITLGFSFTVYYFLYRFAVEAGKPTQKRSKLAYSTCVFLITVSITFTFVNMALEEVPGGMNKKGFSFLMGIIAGTVCAVVFFFVVLPYLMKMKGDLKVTFNLCTKKKNKEEEPKEQKLELEIEDGIESSASLPIIEKDEFIDESDDIKRIFRPLQLLAACFGALTHGSNDVGNCIGPLVTVWYIYQTPIGYSTETQLYGILMWGGIGISLGLVCFGKRVIMTMGTKISRMTPSLGFTVVLTASIVVMMCSIVGIPTSTTHCQVMGVVGCGVAKGWVDSGSFKGGLQTIDLSLMRNIALSWIVTIPFALVLSSMLYAVARVLIIGAF